MSVARDRVVDNYAAQKPNRNHEGRVVWSYERGPSMYGGGGTQIYCDGQVLYSYGPHFPLASIIGIEGAGTDKQRFLFVKNGDKASSTTNTHQALTQRACDGPTVSASALEAAGIDFLDLVLKPTTRNKITVPDKDTGERSQPIIVFWREDKREYLWRDDDGNYTTAHDYPEKKFTPPKQGMFVASSRQKEDGKTYGYWHILGAVVIFHKGKYYLCGLDDGTYFVCELPKTPRNCDDAYEVLKPREVKKAEAEGAKVLRQGEWFFVPTGMKDKDLANKLEWTQTKLLKRSKVEALPRRSTDSNKHECRQLKLQGGKRVYAKGKVFHRSAYGRELTNQHPTVNLGDEWFVVYHNTEVQSWSMGGTFD